MIALLIFVITGAMLLAIVLMAYFGRDGRDW